MAEDCSSNARLVLAVCLAMEICSVPRARQRHRAPPSGGGLTACNFLPMLRPSPSPACSHFRDRDTSPPHPMNNALKRLAAATLIAFVIPLIAADNPVSDPKERAAITKTKA